MESQPKPRRDSGSPTKSMTNVELMAELTSTQVGESGISPIPAQSLMPRDVQIRGTTHPHPEAFIEEYKMFITLVFGVSIFGASTFAVVIGQMTDPADIWKPKKPPFAMETVRTFLGAAWLCFTLTIAVAGSSSSFLTFFKGRGAQDDNARKKWEGTAIAASALLWTLLVTAFLFLSLAMVPYAYVPGWIAVASTTLFGIWTVCLISLQVRGHLRDS